MTTDVATALCLLCQQILEVPRVAPDDDLFDLDPDSLTLNRLNVAIQQTWGVEVPVDVFYDTASISDLAEAIVGLQDTAKAST